MGSDALSDCPSRDDPMHNRLRFARRVGLIIFATFVQLLASNRSTAQVPAPETHFGFRMGADRQLASIENIERYFELVAAGTTRVRIIDIGRTTEGHRTLAALISAPENLANLAEIRNVNQRLADPRTLSRDDAVRLARTHKAVVAIGASIHASEIGGSQAASELLYRLATSDAPEITAILQNVVIVLIPSLNPDGHRMIVDWYDRTKGTPFEGTEMPRLDHKYAGHDLNRDAFMMNLAESRNLARFFYNEWHPQVFLSLHQMGTLGPRMFVPPVADPIGPNYDPLIWREAALLGSAMALELQHDGRRGVISSALYDYYSPGYEDSAPLGHNTVCLLAEVARAQLATPITVTAEDLRSQHAGATSPAVSFPDPWPGGRWSPRDVVDYDLSAMYGLLRAASAYREQIVANFYEMGVHAVDAGRRDAPFAFAVMPDQFDPLATAKLEELLLQGGVEIHRAVEPFRTGNADYPAGTDLILMAQPYRAYAKTLLERQQYPGVRGTTDRTAIRPYDVTGWTLPAQMGVDVRAIDRAFQIPVMSRVTTATIAAGHIWGDRKPSFYVVDTRGNAGVVAMNRLLAAGVKTSATSRDVEIDGYRYPAGSIVVATSKVAQTAVPSVVAELGLRATGTKRKPAVDSSLMGTARIAVYRSSTDNADEGWTRWVLDQHEFRYTSIGDADIRTGNLRPRFDVVILPSASYDQLISGNPTGEVPAEYAGGLGEPGVSSLIAFVESGGTLVCLDQSCAAAIARMKLPLQDVAQTSSDRLYGPGSILKVDVDPEATLGRGINAHTAGFFAYSSAYEIVGEDPRVKVIARYGASDILVSGWLDGGDVIAKRAAAVEVSVSAGRVVVLGFPVQHRGQSLATFRLLFNPLFLTR